MDMLPRRICLVQPIILIKITAPAPFNSSYLQRFWTNNRRHCQILFLRNNYLKMVNVSLQTNVTEKKPQREKRVFPAIGALFVDLEL